MLKASNRLSGSGVAVVVLVAGAAFVAGAVPVIIGTLTTTDLSVPPRLAVTVPPATLAIGAALVLDLLVGEPPSRIHPVAWFGRLVAPLDRSWSHPQSVGLVAAIVLPLAAAGTVAGLVAAGGTWRPPAGVVLAAVWLFVSTSFRRLLAVAGDVSALVEADPERARHRLRALAGRDAVDLSAGEVRSAVVESLAENLSDGLVAPLLAFTVGAVVGTHLLTPGPLSSPVPSLALGVGAAAWVKAVNTMDSMLGYRTKPVGWAPARLDDLVMWVPARTSALLLAVAARDPGSPGRARAWIDDVPSPNAGWPMGVAAAVLDVRLEKPGVYVIPGGSALPTGGDVTRARRLCAGAGLLAYLLAGVVTWL